MARRPRTDPKAQALRDHGALNPNPEAISDPLFRQCDFFDARDRVQAKYEMLRRVKVEGERVSKVTDDFGVSRPTFYQAQAAFDSEGMAGLLPKKRGPHGGHKLTTEVMDFIEECRRGEESMEATTLARRVTERFDIQVHPRTIERALKKKPK